MKSFLTKTTLLLLATSLSAQTKATPKPSLKETITWIENYSVQHGFITLNTGFTRTNAMREFKGCSVSLEINFPKATKPSEVKSTRAIIALSDFDPNTVREETDKDAGTYGVNFERSDSSPAIEENTEMGDGTKSKMWAAEETMFFDSEESSKRFSTALAHAITLCGGKPAPF
jgi:hypothetical protein